MKKTIVPTLMVALTSVSLAAFAQPSTKDAQPQQKEVQEIIIRSKGDSALSMKVDINGDQISVNGKPLSQFNQDGITINKRKMIIRGDQGEAMEFKFDHPQGGMPEMFGGPEGEPQEQGAPKPFLGVSTDKTAEGAKVVEVNKGSAAEKAGLLVGDILTKVDGQATPDQQNLAAIIATKKPKDEIKLSILREGKKKDLKAILGERKTSITKVFTFRQPNGMGNGEMMPPTEEMNMELNMENLDPSVMEDIKQHFQFPRQQKLGLKIQDVESGESVKVIEVAPESAAEKAGLKKDDLITAINGQAVHNTDEAREQLQAVKEQSTYQIKAKRNGAALNFEIKLPKKLKTADL